MIAGGFFSPAAPELFTPIIDSLLNQGDHYMLLADYASYIACQEEVSALYRRPGRVGAPGDPQHRRHGEILQRPDHRRVRLARSGASNQEVTANVALPARGVCWQAK